MTSPEDYYDRNQDALERLYDELNGAEGRRDDTLDDAATDFDDLAADQLAADQDDTDDYRYDLDEREEAEDFGEGLGTS